MPVQYIDWLDRNDIRRNVGNGYHDRQYYVFGDNMQRRGYGGQAGECRGEPNVIGVATKVSPGMGLDDFFNDDDASHWEAVACDIAMVEFKLAQGHTVYVPRAGIGTGLSEMPTRCPTLYNFIVRSFQKMEGEPCPWQLTPV